MLLDIIKDYRIVLASQSPRRKELLQGIGLTFDVIATHADESFSPEMKKEDVPVILAERKADAITQSDNTIIIAADTIVCINDEIINKPEDYDHAVEMLTKLSGNKHQVITGVCIKKGNEKISFYAVSDVYFNPLTLNEINHYIRQYKPYDKAGAYGIQEWIGYIGIEKIEGSFYNVMGLPVGRVYEELKKLLKVQ